MIMFFCVLPPVSRLKCSCCCMCLEELVSRETMVQGCPEVLFGQFLISVYRMLKVDRLRHGHFRKAAIFAFCLISTGATLPHSESRQLQSFSLLKAREGRRVTKLSLFERSEVILIECWVQQQLTASIFWVKSLAHQACQEV